MCVYFEVETPKTAALKSSINHSLFPETLRLYPPGTVGDRRCTKEYK